MRVVASWGRDAGSGHLTSEGGRRSCRCTSDTIGDTGVARILRTLDVDGVKLAESASTLGMALEDLEAGEGLIWVLVNVQ